MNATSNASLELIPLETDSGHPYPHEDKEYIQFVVTTPIAPYGGTGQPSFQLEGLSRCSECHCLVSQIQWGMHQTYHQDQANLFYTMARRLTRMTEFVELIDKMLDSESLTLADLIGHYQKED